MMAARRSHLLKPFTICTDSCVTVTALNDHLEVRGGPPEMLLAATDYRPQKINLKGSNRFARGNTMITHGKNSPPATSPVPKRSVSSDTMEKPPKLQDAITGNLNLNLNLRHVNVERKSSDESLWERFPVETEGCSDT